MFLIIDFIYMFPIKLSVMFTSVSSNLCENDQKQSINMALIKNVFNMMLKYIIINLRNFLKDLWSL